MFVDTEVKINLHSNLIRAKTVSARHMQVMWPIFY